MTFKARKITVSFILAPVRDSAGNPTSQPTFAGSDANKVTLEGLRIQTQIIKAGGASQGEAHLRIYGMKLDLMNQLSLLGKTPVIISSGNIIEISAGDDDSVALVFRGYISQAYTDLGGAPEGVFVVDAYSLLYQAVQIIPPTSFKGTIPAATVMQQIAGQMNLPFTNNGVTTILTNPSYNGSAKTQAETCLKEASAEWNAAEDGTIAIWPKGSSRGGSITLVSKETGLIGYPYPSGQGLLGLRTLFNPAITYGGQIQVRSSIAPANGTWTLRAITHELASEMPGGEWFSSIVGSPPGYVPIT